jgi:hypothetical protein
MRKLLLSSMIFMLASSLHAQFQKNSIYGDLSFGYRITQYDAVSSTTGITLGLDEKNSIGFFLDRTRTRGRSTDLNGIRNNITGFGGGISFTHASYFNQKKKWGWMITSTLSYTNNRLLNQSPAGAEKLTGKVNSFSLGISPGLIWKASEHFTFFAQFAAFSVYKNNVNSSFRTEMYPQIKLGTMIRLGSIKKKHR